MTLKRKKVLTEPEAIAILKSMVEQGEHNVCGKMLDKCIEQHHNLYLRYCEMRDRRK